MQTHRIAENVRATSHSGKTLNPTLSPEPEIEKPERKSEPQLHPAPSAAVTSNTTPRSNPDKKDNEPLADYMRRMRSTASGSGKNVRAGKKGGNNKALFGDWNILEDIQWNGHGKRYTAFLTPPAADQARSLYAYSGSTFRTDKGYFHVDPDICEPAITLLFYPLGQVAERVK